MQPQLPQQFDEIGEFSGDFSPQKEEPLVYQPQAFQPEHHQVP